MGVSFFWRGGTAIDCGRIYRVTLYVEHVNENDNHSQLIFITN